MNKCHLSKKDSVLVITLLFFAATMSTVHADSKSMLDKEKRWEEQIVPSLVVGEAIKLKANGVKFLALFTEPTTEKLKGAVILLHGGGVHPAWPDVIEPLRMELPDRGWHTLSLQMPILGNDANDKDYPPLFPEVPGRIQAGVDFLKHKGIDNIVLAGHSMGSSMAGYYLATNKDPSVKGFIIVSNSYGVPGDRYLDNIENFKKFKHIQILDMHGSEDLKPVLKASAQRKLIGTKLFGNHYQSLQINGAGHFYRERTEELVTQVEKWLNKNIKN